MSSVIHATPSSETAAAGDSQTLPVEVSVVMPCLNEAETLGTCIAKARGAIEKLQLRGEIVVADNGSTDNSLEIAEKMSARVVHVETRGYGSALQGGIAAARGELIVMGDADDSYDFTQIGVFVDKLREGYDVVMGNRFKGGIFRGAMPPLHKYLGNPVLTRLGRLLFKSPCGDFHCGLRAFRKDAILRLGLRTTGMEFASEMVVKASLFGLRITEVPTTLSPDGRSTPPHLRTWRDGWRHLRFMMLYSPRWLFLYPGALLMLLGTLLGIWLLPGPQIIGGVGFDIHTLVFAAMAVLLGFQAIVFAAFTKVFAVTEGLLPADERVNRLFRTITLEVGLAIGGALMAIGLAISLGAVWYWSTRHFGPLEPTRTLRLVIPGVVSLTLGVQTVLSSFFLSVLGMARR
jgi:glycosyltransferase involved in cell wall biosynthesis